MRTATSNSRVLTPDNTTCALIRTISFPIGPSVLSFVPRKPRKLRSVYPPLQSDASLSDPNRIFLRQVADIWLHAPKGKGVLKPAYPINKPSGPLLQPPQVSQHGVAGWQLRCGDDGSTKKGAGARFPTRPIPSAFSHVTRGVRSLGPKTSIYSLPQHRLAPALRLNNCHLCWT